VVIVVAKLSGFVLPIDTSLPHDFAPTLLFFNGYSSIAFTIIIMCVDSFFDFFSSNQIGGGRNHPQFFFFLLKKFNFFLFKIKIKNKLHDTCQDLIGPRVIFVSQLTVNGWKD
jgi:hypothetical protein